MSVQTMWAQRSMKVWRNGEFELFKVSEVDSISFVSLVTDIFLSEDEMTMKVGDSKRLTATIYPIDADERTLIWESDNTGIATVDQTGKITAISRGSCTITAKATDGSDVKAECAVTVVQLVTNITLSQTSISLYTGMSEVLTAIVLPEDADNKDVVWESSNDGIASIDQTGNVTAVSPGECTITCSATDGSGVKTECQVTVIKHFSCPDGNHPHAIDLGLPSGTKWCCCNVGASKPEEYGGYYAWGETSEKSVYNHVTYKYFTGVDTDGDGWYDRNWSYTNIGSDIAGTSYDAATVNMGEPWRMPSFEQQKELIDNSLYQWVQQDGVDGMLVTGPNGSQIFLPAAGLFGPNGNKLDRFSEVGVFWSGSDDEFNAKCMGLSSSHWDLGFNDRAYGLSVRAVCP